MVYLQLAQRLRSFASFVTAQKLHRSVPMVEGKKEAWLVDESGKLLQIWHFERSSESRATLTRDVTAIEREQNCLFQRA